MNDSAQLEERHVVRLFSRMMHLFGHKWISVYGPAMDGTTKDLTASARQWAYDLREYSPEQVAQAIGKIERMKPEWPPGPLDFANLCDGVPSLAEVLDRANDYGPVCAAIRGKLDWYNLELLPARAQADLVKQKMEVAIAGLRQSGQLLAIRQTQQAALTAERATGRALPLVS